MNSIQSSPTVVDDSLFVGDGRGTLYAIDAETGNRRWAFESTRIRSSPTVADGTVFVGSFDHNLYAVDAETGNQQWAFETGDFIASSPTVIDSTVFVGSDDGYLYAVDAETGDQEWAFQTGGRIRSSPTVVDGTVLVGSSDGNICAVDTETGDQRWEFEIGSGVNSSPTVVDGTVFVGSADGNLYAVATGVDGSSEDSRVLLGTLGHHGDRRFANQSIDIPAHALYTSWVRNNADWLAIGGVGIGGGIGGISLIRRREDTRESKQDPPNESSGESSAMPPSETAQSTTPTDQSGTDASSRVDEFRSEAETALEMAVAAKENNLFDEAEDAYDVALTQYEAALDELDAGDAETRTKVEESIDAAHAELTALETLHEQQEEIIETLETAEHSFQVAIMAYVEGSQTLARIRFRQARDSFAEAVDIVEDSDEDLLSPPVEVSVQPDRELASTALSELPAVPEAAVASLSDAGVNEIDELEEREEPPWPPTPVETLATEETTSDRVETTLTLLSWWEDTDSHEFETAAAVSRRRDQAEYGFARSS
ncbi:PQQ-like domain-containing protein [Halorubrum xinjiangense]|uniref:PQQ-like domain-containing protein n=2 Tax=Halorubrum xinjiangense TaxID=261291 RepID=A0A1G7L4E2_9EURY|nr:PQQ-like domain-containing protein [Halorubrum xinjiangense]